MGMGTTGEHVDESPNEVEESEPLTEATVVDTLRNQRRRYALYYLQNNESPVAYEDLVNQVAAWENDATPDDVTPTQRKSVYSALHQKHLPALERVGLITYDRDRKQISPAAGTGEYELELAADLHTAVAWWWLYLGTAVVGYGLLAATLLGYPPLSAVSDLSVAGLIVGGFALVSLCHSLDVVRWKQRVKDMPPDIHFRREWNGSERK